MKSVFPGSAPVCCVPLVAFAPVQPPAAVHAVALVVDHVRVDFEPTGTVVGLALKVTVGDAPLTLTVTD